MKTSFRLFSAAVIALVSMNLSALADDVVMHDGVIMKGDHMMLMKNDETTKMTHDVKMTNGTMVTKDGAVVLADGKTEMMKNGDSMTMDGTMMKASHGKGMMHPGGMMKGGM